MIDAALIRAGARYAGARGETRVVRRVKPNEVKYEVEASRDSKRVGQTHYARPAEFATWAEKVETDG
jgi:hypothetical protein